eukprot:6193629-Pleurochrysis_carterae.AAC.1
MARALSGAGVRVDVDVKVRVGVDVGVRAGDPARVPEGECEECDAAAEPVLVGVPVAGCTGARGAGERA